MSHTMVKPGEMPSFEEYIHRKQEREHHRSNHMRRRGSRGLQWQRIDRELKKRFAAAGIDSCEMNYQGCWRDDGLQFCHDKKRRFCVTDDELRVVIRGCPNCHPILESKGHKLMHKEVHDIINARKVQP